MNRKKLKLVEEKRGSLVDTSTASSLIDIALLKETRLIAEIIHTANGRRPNLRELYNEMWIFNQEAEGQS